MNSWGVYLVAALALVLVLAPQLSAVTASSRKESDWRYLDGVRQAIDSLEPGVVLNVTFTSPLMTDPVLLSGHALTIDYGSGTLGLSSRWPLPDIALRPSSHYLLSLVGGTVTVSTLV